MVGSGVVGSGVVGKGVVGSGVVGKGVVGSGVVGKGVVGAGVRVQNTPPGSWGPPHPGAGCSVLVGAGVVLHILWGPMSNDICCLATLCSDHMMCQHTRCKLLTPVRDAGLPIKLIAHGRDVIKLGILGRLIRA